jgi:hypothetical protein
MMAQHRTDETVRREHRAASAGSHLRGSAGRHQSDVTQSRIAAERVRSQLRICGQPPSVSRSSFRASTSKSAAMSRRS